MKCEQRWQNKEQIIAYNEYVRKKKNILNKKILIITIEKRIARPIEKIKLQYLMVRKSWFITPLGWENIAINGGM